MKTKFTSNARRPGLSGVIRTTLFFLALSITVGLISVPSGWTGIIPDNDTSGANTAVAGDSLPVLIDLGADRCVPCKMMAPILDQLEREYVGKFDIVFYDVWKDPAPAEKYGIRGIPTQIFLDEDGKELYRHAGYYSKEQILAKWRELGYDFK